MAQNCRYREDRLNEQQRPIALVTGAHGGMGSACARRLGLRCRLVLTDIDGDRLSRLSQALHDEGHTVVGVVAEDVTRYLTLDVFNRQALRQPIR